MPEEIIVTRISEFIPVFKIAIKQALEEMAREQNSRSTEDRLYTVNQVRKRLHKSHTKVKQLIRDGLMKTTKDGLIPESSINEYLQKS